MASFRCHTDDTHGFLGGATSLPKPLASEDAYKYGWLQEATPKSAAYVLRSLAAIEVGAGSVDPFMAPLYVGLKEASVAVNKAVRRGKDLRELLAVCAVVTGRVMVKAEANDSPSFDVSVLKKCLEEQKEVAEHYGHAVVSARNLPSLMHGDRIHDLRVRINRLALIMGPVATVAIGREDQDTPVMSWSSAEDIPRSFGTVTTPNSGEIAPKGLVQGLAAMEVETDSVPPFIAPLLVALKATSGVVDRAVLNKIELEGLIELCTNITGKLIQKVQADSSSVAVWPLQECIQELQKVAEICGQKITSTRAPGDRIQNLRTRIDVLNIWHQVEDISQTPARGPTRFILASRVDPGSTVLESRRHGIRLTVPLDSLDRAIGPITLHQMAQVVERRNDRKRYLLTTVIDCQPLRIKFPRQPLLLDFFLEGAPSATDISGQFQVLVRENQAGCWRKLASKVHVDESGACFLRAVVKGFTCFSAAAIVNSADPFRTEVCKVKGMIGLGNSSNVKAYFVFVPTSFDTDNTVRDHHNAGGNAGVAGISFGGSYGAERERATSRHRLSTGITPSEFILLPGASLEFSPPTGSSGGQLVVAMLPSQSQSTSSIQVVDYYAQFPVREGHTKIVLQGCLDGGRLNRTAVLPGDKLVNAVMLMASLRPEGRDAATVASSPQSANSRSAPSIRMPIVPIEPPSTTATAAAVLSPAHSQGGATVRTCLIS